MVSYKPQESKYQKLFLISLIFLSTSLVIFILSFKPKSNYITDQKYPSMPTNSEPWLDLIVPSKLGPKKMKVGLVNADDQTKHLYDNMKGFVEVVNVDFEHASDELSWKTLFPEWIDEHEKWHKPKCPEIQMPVRREEYYGGLDVIMARFPCRGGGVEEEGIRDVFRLQVNLVVANLVVANGWDPHRGEFNQTVYVVFKGSCGPMREIFRCDDLMTRLGDYWVYKPDLWKLKQKVDMPVGTCQIAPFYKDIGKESMTRLTNDIPRSKPHQRAAYVTVLHSSEAYVCGAISLAQSILLTNSTKDLVLLHDSSISPKSLSGLRAAGWKTREIQPIRSPFAKKGSYNEWNYSKLRIWQLVDYDKVIFIDADLIALKNMDKFFDYPQLSASPNSKNRFNSGVMVIEPSMCTFEDLLSKSTKLFSYNGGDQGFLNEFFPWWHRLPLGLNHLKIFGIRDEESNKNHEILRDEVSSYTLHFLGVKPWLCYRDYDCNWDREDHFIFASDSGHEKWWQVYDAMPKKLQNYCGLTRKIDARIQKWRGRAKIANLDNGHWKIELKDPRQYCTILLIDLLIKFLLYLYICTQMCRSRIG